MPQCSCVLVALLLMNKHKERVSHSLSGFCKQKNKHRFSSEDVMYGLEATSIRTMSSNVCSSANMAFTSSELFRIVYKFNDLYYLFFGPVQYSRPGSRDNRKVQRS